MSRAPKTRQSLLLELRKHSDEAWTEFVRVYEEAILQYSRAMGLGEEDARDVVQEVLAAVHQRVGTWRADASAGSFRAWLFRVARNLSVNALSARARAAGSADDGLLAQVAAEESQSLFDVELKRAQFDWAADRVRSEVHESTWLAFYGSAVEGRSASAVAQELGVSLGSVYTAKCRVLARIRERLGELSGALESPPES